MEAEVGHKGYTLVRKYCTNKFPKNIIPTSMFKIELTFYKGACPYSYKENLIYWHIFFLFKSITINKVTFLNIRSKKNPENFRFFIYSGTSCSSGVGFYGDDEHIINLKEPGCGTVLDNNLKTLPIILVFFMK